MLSIDSVGSRGAQPCLLCTALSPVRGGTEAQVAQALHLHGVERWSGELCCPRRCPGCAETLPPAGFSCLPQSPRSPGGWGCILSGPLQARHFFEVSCFILKTHASSTLCSSRLSIPGCGKPGCMRLRPRHSRHGRESFTHWRKGGTSGEAGHLPLKRHQPKGTAGFCPSACGAL